MTAGNLSNLDFLGQEIPIEDPNDNRIKEDNMVSRGCRVRGYAESRVRPARLVTNTASDMTPRQDWDRVSTVRIRIPD